MYRVRTEGGETATEVLGDIATFLRDLYENNLHQLAKNYDLDYETSTVMELIRASGFEDVVCRQLSLLEDERPYSPKELAGVERRLTSLKFVMEEKWSGVMSSRISEVSPELFFKFLDGIQAYYAEVANVLEGSNI
jgi:hypothetical protein